MTDSSSTVRRIPAPDPDRPPLKANVFHESRVENTKLAPLFPYTEDGCILPGLCVFWGGPGRGGGSFTHYNTVDEIAMFFGAHGCRARVGDVLVAPREHLVTSFFESPEAPDNMAILVVTQRQAEKDVPQREVLSYRCAKCQEILFRYEYVAKVGHHENAELPGYHAVFDTIVESAKCFEPLNANAEVRTCKKCGHVSPPLPGDMLGCASYYRQFVAAEQGRAQFVKAGLTTEFER